MFLVNRLRALRLSGQVLAQRTFYERSWDPSAAREWQLAQFNQQWQALVRTIPYYHELRRQHQLPESFRSWNEFASRVPACTRADVQHAGAAMRNPARRVQAWRSTGGSTGEPLRIPIWNQEARIASQDLWYARSWFGISPADRLFLIWGHSHLLGSGLAGRVNGWRRKWQDRLLGYERWSAYSINDAELRAAAERLLTVRPAWVLGYSVALDRFARVNADRAAEFRGLGLKAVIATAESFPRDDSREALRDLFDCPVVMEYGAVETGPIAHQRLEDPYAVFWRRYFVETLPADGPEGARQIAVTALFPRSFPLVRYKLGDLLHLDPEEDASRTFRSVVGRCNDCVTLTNGCIVHSETFTHAVKESPIDAFQVVESRQTGVALRYAAAAALTAAESQKIRERLARALPGSGEIPLVHVAALERTVAGKTPCVLHVP